MVVIAAVDRSGRSAHIVSEAISLAAAFDGAVHVIHTLTCSEFIDLGLTGAQAEGPRDIDEIRSTAAGMVEGSALGPDVPCETTELVGNPADEAIEHADG